MRRAVLRAVFALLYGPLAFLHEVAGRVVAGSAWDGRRVALLDSIDNSPMLDIGCGEGRLLSEAASRGLTAFGVEPSRAMSRRASRRGATVMRARAQRLPVRDGSMSAVAVTYPGPWITDPRTWAEIERIARPGASVSVLLGGQPARRQANRFRRGLLRVAYGSAGPSGTISVSDLPPLGVANGRIAGEYAVEPDEWGTALIWRGRLVD